MTAVTDGQVFPAELTHVESRYYKSAIHNGFGLGHSGWGGQLIWADPASDTVMCGVSDAVEDWEARVMGCGCGVFEVGFDLVRVGR